MNDVASAILEKNKYAVLSTVREDGAPWATPIHFANDENNIYWLSNDDTVHSINIVRDNRVFVTIFNSNQESKNDIGSRGALYVSTHASKLEGNEALEARKVFASQHEDSNSHKHGDWSIFGAPFGELNPSKTIDDRIYYKYSAEIAK